MTHCFSQVLLFAELCCTETKSEGSKALGDTEAEFIFSLRVVDIFQCTALASAHMVLSYCAPQKAHFELCSATIATHKSYYLTIKNFHGNILRLQPKRTGIFTGE